VPVVLLFTIMARHERRLPSGGLIIGVASGMGFAALETMGYAFSALLSSSSWPYSAWGGCSWRCGGTARSTNTQWASGWHRPGNRPGHGHREAARHGSPYEVKAVRSGCG
jgi:hypothetical protein